MNTSKGRANRLAETSSPYLLQHAYNPVDWWPWCDEAFAEAVRRDVPVLLSIGYSTCYWCHVMERESFENAAIAARMNELFVCIKVDREERPDIDSLYMSAAIAMNDHAGWPLTVFLEPEARTPYWCGTYFPPDDETRPGMPGLPRVLAMMNAAWRERREEVLGQSCRLADAVRAQLGGGEDGAAIGEGQVTSAVGALLSSYDRIGGGFGKAPKFPQPGNLEFLLDARSHADEATRAAIDAAVRGTLDAMMIGGIHDHVGGGFHRYAVDANWTVPHFEKMLYDNAQLTNVYARASEVYEDAAYASVAEGVLGYVVREMTAEAGGFFSAQDAEVGGREGLDYLWTEKDVRGALGEGEDAELAVSVYGLSGGPIFKDPHHAAAPAMNILRLSAHPEEVAREHGLGIEEFNGRMKAINERLLGARRARPRAARDDKVIVAWNGMMIGAMCRCSKGTLDTRWLNAAARAAGFILERVRDERGGLARSRRAGVASGAAFLEDYACLAQGLIALADAMGEADEAKVWRGRAIEITEAALELFDDGSGGALSDVQKGRGGLFVRPMTLNDGAEPCGQSVMMHVLLDLHAMTGEARWKERAISMLATNSGQIARWSIGCLNSTRALMRVLTGVDSDDVSARLGRGAAIEDASGTRAVPASPVAVFADVDRISVGVDAPGKLHLIVKIEEGYHVPAADPGESGAGLAPFRVGVHNGSGLAVYADYPTGSAWRVDQGLNVYEGEVEMLVAVEREGELRGKPLLTVTFQACSDRECLEPTTVELDVAIDVL